MAQVLAEATRRYPDALAIGIMGNRHVANGDGVAHQLRSLGVNSIVSLLPWDAGEDCAGFSTGLADAVFGVPAAQPIAAAAAPLRLGIQIQTAADGVMILAVEAASVAAATGLRTDDVLVEVAGTPVKTAEEAKALVGRTAPGTWLPLKLKRQAELVELTAKFPAKK
jgi:S1-C subfamily serine protease